MSESVSPVERLEAIRVALSDIQVQLLELPKDAFGDRLDLRQRQTELREEARRLGTLSAPADSEAAMRERLRRLQRDLDKKLDGRISHAAAAQTGRGGGIDPLLVHQMNRQIDQGTGVEGLRKEISDLKRRLETLRPDEG